MSFPQAPWRFFATTLAAAASAVAAIQPGTVLAQPAAAPASAPTTTPTAPRPVTFAADVFFDVDKSILKPEAKRKLTVLARQMKQLELRGVTIIGHTDATASDAYNDHLSGERSRAVRQYLIAQGISGPLITITGRGKAEPVSDNHTQQGKSRNRRVEIEVVGLRHPPQAKP